MLQNHSIKSVRGAVLVSPLIRFGVSKFKELAGWIAGYLLKIRYSYVVGDDRDAMLRHCETTGGSFNNSYTSSKEAGEEIRSLSIKYNHLTVGGPTFGWFSAAVESGIQILKKASRISVPLFIASGEKDDIIDIDSNRALADSIKNAQVLHQIYEGAYHEIFREVPTVRESFWKNVDDLRRFISKNSNTIQEKKNFVFNKNPFEIAEEL